MKKTFFLLCAVLLVLGVPICVSLGLSSVVGLLASRSPVTG